MAATTIFIACGEADIEIASGLMQQLARELPDAEVELWNQPGVFELGRGIFDQLLGKADTADFSVILLSEPVLDEETGRLTGISPNVMFELGLFYGRLERYRTVIVSQGAEHLPSDLQGVIVVELDDEAASKIAAQVRKYGKRIPPVVELGSLERMLNVCTPAHADHRTPHLTEVWPQQEEHFDTARDYHDLCRVLLTDYVIGGMMPDQIEHMRAYLAVYLGDGVRISADGDEHIVSRCESRRADPSADATFLVSLSNPWPGASPDVSPAPELLNVHWRVARGIPGFADDDRGRPRSNCAYVFDAQRESTAAAGADHNQNVDDEQEAFAAPILWKEYNHTASVGVLGLSMDARGAALDNESLLGRLRLVSNVLGVAAGRLAQTLQSPANHPVGVRTDDPEDRRSFGFRAVELRRTIGQYVVEQLLQNGDLVVRHEDGEAVLARRA